MERDALRRAAGLGAPFISFNILTGYRSTPRRMYRPFYYADTGCGAGFRRLSDG